MAYEVLAPMGRSVAIPTATSRYTNDNGEETRFYEHETRTYEGGTVLQDDEISPVVLELYEAGDAHVRSVIRKLGDGEMPVAPHEIDLAGNPFVAKPVTDGSDNPITAQQISNEAKRKVTAR